MAGRVKRFVLVGLLPLFLFACRGRDAVRVGSKNFTEQVILGEIAAQALEAEGVKVERKLDLGGTFVCHQALVAGELDLYPEYTGTAFTAILKEKPISDPARVRDAVERTYAEKWKVTWLPPQGFAFCSKAETPLTLPLPLPPCCASSNR